MVDDKKTPKGSQQTVKNNGQNKSQNKSQQANNQESRTKTRLIYRHHRKFMGGGLVGLILLALLVGTEILPFVQSQMDENNTQENTPKNPHTAIKVLTKQTGGQSVDGSTDGKNNPTSMAPKASVVSRNDAPQMRQLEQQQAHIKIHSKQIDVTPQVVLPAPKQTTRPANNDAPAPEVADTKTDDTEDTTLKDKDAPNNKRHKTRQNRREKLTQQVQTLEEMVRGQQQMIRMLAQKQSKQHQKYTQQQQNLSVTKPILMEMNESLTLLQLRQDALFFYTQWQEGLLTVNALRQWHQFVDTKGYQNVASLTGALQQSLETYGVLNKRALKQTAMSVHNKLSAHQNFSAQPSEKTQQSTDENSKTGWWNKLKERLAGLIRIRRLDSASKNELEPNQQATLTDLKDADAAKSPRRLKVSKALAQGDMRAFWALMLEQQQQQPNDDIQDPVLKQLGVLVDAHMAQMDMFQQLYRTLTAAKKRPN